MRIRVPTTIELVIQGLLGAFLALLLIDFLQALGATACSDPNRSLDCYPWGMTEGPMEGRSWEYSSKANYLIASGAEMLVLAIAVLVPFLARDRRSGSIALVSIPVLGWIGFWWVTG
jgi:hypothetical protein